MTDKKNHTIQIVKTLFLAVLIFTGSAGLTQPIANFTGTPLSGCAPLAVSFTDMSTGNPTSWQWNLGNGALSTQQNPTTTYFTSGSYTITLTVTNASGSNTVTKTQYIIVSDKPVVNFTASVTSGCFPLHVNFTDQSTTGSGSLTGWEWDFGDGGSSFAQNPSHTYTTAGNFSVTLKVTNTGGCSRVLSKPNYIQVSQGVVVNFNNSSPQLCHPPETISFTNLSTGPGVLSYQWSFGDGNNSIATNPSNTYLAGGSYTVRLITSSSLGCTDTLIKPAAVIIRNVVSSFSGPDSVCINNPASFINTSIPTSNSSFWDFGDATSSNQVNPVKTWTVPGNYLVKLVNNYGTCNDSVTKVVKALALPLPNFTSTNPVNCQVPFSVNFTDMSTGAVSWAWKFGDGGTSTLQNPSHTYLMLGNYTVTLITTNASGCKDSMVKAQYVKIQKPIVGINGLPTQGCVPFTINPTPNVIAIDGVISYHWDFGDGFTSNAQNPAHTYPTQGNYTVKLVITTTSGCTDSAVIPNAVVVGTTPFVDFSASPLAQCAGQPIQFTDLSVPADRWLWDFGDGGSSTQQNPQYTYQNSGTFTVMLTAWNNGCPRSVTKTNYVTSKPPVANWTAGFNCINRKQVLFSDASTLPQSWNWDFGDGFTSNVQNPVHIYAAYGTYNVTLTVTNGSCSNSITHPITLYHEQPDFNVLPDTICINQQTVFQSTGFNPANISSYYWNFGDGTSVTGSGSVAHIYSSAGSYNVKLVITDNRGCKDSITKLNIIRVWGAKANFSFTPSAGCRPLTVTFNDATITDGTHPITNWHFDYGTGQSQDFSNPPFVHIYDTIGLFNPSLTVTDSYGCTSTYLSVQPVFVTFPKSDFFTADSLTCVGKNVSFTNISIGSGMTYVWKFGDGSNSIATNPVKVYAADGNYTVKLIVTDVNGCRDSISKPAYIKVHTVRASFTLNDSISSCSPFEVHFTNTSIFASSIRWDFGDGSSSTVAAPIHYYSIPGTYIAKLIATGPGGCVDSMAKPIKLYSSAASLTYSPISGCSPLTVSFHVTTQGPVTYLWDLNDGSTITTTDSNLVYNYLLPGSFLPKVILQDQTGCQIPITGIDTIKVTRSRVNFGATDSLYCDVADVQFSDSTITNGTISSYSWTFGDGGNSALRNPLHHYSAPGLYTVRLIVRTTNGCSDTATKLNYIKVVSSPRAGITGDTSACVPATLVFNGVLLVPDTSAVSWKWDFGNGNTSTLQNPPAQSYPNAGAFALSLVVTNSSGCMDTVIKTIQIRPLPLTNAGSDTFLCLGTPVQLMATGANTYSWSPSTYLSCTNCASPFTSTPIDIVYTVTGTTIYGCTSNDSLFVKVKRPFTVQVTPTDDSLCIGQKVMLHATGAENYLWSPATGLNNNRIGNPIAMPMQSVVYKVLGYDSVNCFRDSATVNITVFPYPTVKAGADKYIQVRSSVTLTPVYSPDIISLLWSPSYGLNCTTCPFPIATPFYNTTYTIKVTNNGGCSVQDQLTVFVTCGNENVFIPNTFSPNGDGVNDIFYPRGIGLYTIQSMRIFNRWGEMVYERTNFFPNDAASGWDGTYKGKIAPPDVYTYIIDIICKNNVVLSFKGNVALIQ